MRPFALVVVLALVTCSAMADTHLHGVVRDSLTRSPLTGATVRVDRTVRGPVSDQGAMAGRDGVFHLHDLPAGPVTLRVTMVGYRPKLVDVLVSADTRIEVLLAPDAVHLRNVVVEAERSRTGTATQQATMLTAAEVDEHRGQTFAEVLKQIPGITVMQTGPSIAKPVLHGMSGTRLVLLNAGIAQEGQQWGAEHAPEIDPFTTDRIGVVRGPAAILYGANAMGGVISVEPRPLSDSATWTGELMVNGFWNNRQASGSVVAERGRLFELPLAVRVQAGGRRAGDAATPGYVLRNTGFSEATLALDAALTLDAWTFSAHARRFATTLGIYKGSHLGNPADLQRAILRGGPADTVLFSYDIGNPRQYIEHRLLSVTAEARLSPADDLRITYGWQQNLRQEFDAHNTRIVGRGTDPVERARDSIERLQRAIATPAMELLLTTYSADARWDRRLADTWTMTTAINGLRQVNDRSGSVYLVPDYAAHGLGAATLHTWSRGDVTLTAGLRYDVRWLAADVRDRRSNAAVRQERTFSNLAGSIGVAWAMSEALTTTLNIGSGWRPPQVNELYANDVHHGVALYEVGDSTLRPERNVAVDATVRWANPGIDVELTGYAHQFDGYIYSLPDPANPTVTVRGTFPTYRFTQHDARIAGADVKATVVLDATWSIIASAAVVRGADLVRDLPLFMMPADRGRLGVHVHLPDVLGVHDAFLETGVMGVRRQDRFVANEDYVDPPAGYALVDASLGGTIHLGSADIRFTLSGTNLFDRACRDYLSRFRYMANDPGRDIILRIHVPFNH